MWKNIVDPARRQIPIWCMRIACWIPKATNADSEYIILIAFPLLHWLHDRASMFCLCVHCLCFCNRDGMCSLCGTDWIFNNNSGRFGLWKGRFIGQEFSRRPSPFRPVFDPSLLREGFMVDKLVLWYIFLSSSVFPSEYHSNKASCLS